MGPTERLLRCERGAVFVQIGIAAFVLMSFNVFVLDYGMMWIGRHQAQNAADAGALAGAVARGYDEVGIPGALTQQSASQIATANLIWQQPGTPVVTYPPCPAGFSGRCVRVDVDRSIETLFGPLLGVNTQPVHATATAIARNGNATPCLRPWAVADGWTENGGLPSEFNRYVEPSAGTLLSTPDTYTPPSATVAGATTVSGDFGWRLVWDLEEPLNSPVTREFVLPLDLPGGNTYEDNMLGCNGQPITLGQTLSVHTSLGGGVATTTIQGVFDLDAGADYNYAASRIFDSCAPACAPVSPRLMAIILYDPDKFQLGRASNNWTQPNVGCPTNNPCVTVANIIGLFVHRVTPGGFGPHGHFLRYPGMTVPAAPTFADDGSWLVTTHLVR
jgi:Flp pilus assembly protein TadG